MSEKCRAGHSALRVSCAVMLPFFLGLAGCSMGPDFVRPHPVMPDHWQNAGTTPAARPASPFWWTMFDDPALNSLMMRAETGNLDMALARERIKAARIQRRAASAESLPTLNGQAAYTRERLATAGVGQVLRPLLGLSPGAEAQEPEGVAYTNYSTGAVASWELDLWGRQRRLREAAHAQEAAVKADADAMRLSTQAELARTYFQWLKVSDALNRAEDTLENARHLLRIAETVRAHGLLATVDLDEVRIACHAALEKKEGLAMQQAALLRALGVLAAGRPDADLPELHQPASLLAEKIPHVSASMPSEIARKRPDIQAAEARLHAATATIGMAQADFYPQITLTGQISLDALTLAELGWNARNTSFGPSLTLPVFNGGRLSRQLELRHSEQKTAGMLYQMAVVNAWVEIENLLSEQKLLKERVQDQQELVNREKARVLVLQKRYERGDSARTDVLRASVAETEQEEDLAALHAALLTNAVNLKIASG